MDTSAAKRELLPLIHALLSWKSLSHANNPTPMHFFLTKSHRQMVQIDF
jgi:hypothetical protein